MTWSEYIDHVLSNKTAYDEILISFHGVKRNISPVVKASLIMLEDMHRAKEQYSIFVFPSIKSISHDFIIARVISGISTQGIDSAYDPHLFEQGQKLGFQDCVVIFDHCSVDENTGTERIWMSFSDGGKLAIPIKYAPFFQKVDSKRISKLETFKKKYYRNRALMESGSIDLEGDIVRQLKNIKTHLDGTVVYVSEIGKTKDFLRDATINGRSLSDTLYLSHMNGDGELSNIGPGQMTGHPAIAIASDLYSVINGIEKGVVVNEIVFDESLPNSVVKQLDAFDQIIQKKIPLTCITDTANSFDDKELVDRGFKEWRWNSGSITESLYNRDNNRVSGIYVRNCGQQKVHYISVENEPLCKAVDVLYSIKNDIEDKPVNVITAYNKLFYMALTMLKRIIPTEKDATYFIDILSDCQARIEQEKRFISEELRTGLLSVKEWLSNSLSFNSKCNALRKVLENDEIFSLCIIISKRDGKDDVMHFWRNECGTEISIQVMYPAEYASCEKAFDATVVSGWLGSRDMKKILYCFASAECYVLLYDYENRWKRSHIRTWKQKTDSAGNSEIVKTTLNANKMRINPEDLVNTGLDNQYEEEATDNTEVYSDEGDELEAIEEVLRQSRYRHYESSTGSQSELVEAYPISFVGGIIAFFREGHKLIVATDIIHQRGDAVHQKLPEEISIGDFIVLREKEQKSDIIRDMADIILAKEGKKGIRAIAKKWKEALSIELVFSTPDEVYKKLRENGCSKDFATVRNWIYDEDIITPKSKEDLAHIAAVTGDEVLQQKIDIVFEAGKQIKSAHIKAGRELSDRLKSEIRSTLKGMDVIDPFNIWDPVSIQVEDIGIVKILKVIDIGAVMQVEASNTNRLFAE